MSYPFSNQFEAGDFMDESQQQLSPVTGYPQWETIEGGEQQRHQQHQTESPLDTSMDSTTPTGPTPIAFRSINIEMDEMSRNIMPTSAVQIDNTPITLHHPHVLQQHHLQQHHHQQQQQFFQQQQYHQQHQQSRHPSVEPFSTHSSRPGSSSQLHVVTSPTDLFRPQSTTPITPIATTEAGPSTSNTAGRRGTRKTSGAIRSSNRVTRSQQQAPYYRQSPASTAVSFLGLEVPHAGSAGSSTSSTPRIPQQAEPTPRKQTVRFTAVTTGPEPVQTRAASRAAASSAMPSPVAQLSCPTSQFPENSGSATT